MDSHSTTDTQQNSQSNTTAQQQQIRLVDVALSSKNDAFNLMIQFLQLANRRGAFGMEESSKIWECIKMFKEDEKVSD